MLLLSFSFLTSNQLTSYPSIHLSIVMSFVSFSLPFFEHWILSPVHSSFHSLALFYHLPLSQMTKRKVMMRGERGP